MSLSPSDLIVDSPGDFRVHSDAYTSPEIFELEMRRVFEESWVYVAHESQIPEAGDFVTTRIGTQPVIVTRDGSGGPRIPFSQFTNISTSSGVPKPAGPKKRAVQWVRLDRGLHRERAQNNALTGHSTDETPQRSAYRRWRALMQDAPSGPQA